MTIRTFTILPASELILAALLIFAPGSGAAAAPCFTAVDAEPLGTVADNALVLHAGWRMRESAIVGVDGAALSQTGFHDADWYETSVPATPLGVLVRHGVYPDPYVGLNNLRIPDVSDEHNRRYHLGGFSHLPDHSNPWSKPYWFRKEFSLPASYRGKVVWLHLDGINYRADVWLNGRKIADAKSVVGMFRRFHFDVSPYIRSEGPNALAVCIHMLDFPGSPVREQLDGLPGMFRPCGGDGEILRNVTQYCSMGWDWVPPVRDRNMGIWQHVWLEATGPVAVRDPAAMTEVSLPDADKAAVTIRCQLENSTPLPQTVELLATIAPPGNATSPVKVRTKVDLPANRLTEVILKPQDHPSLVLGRPQLWWPVTYGRQPLYLLTVQALVDGRPSSQVARRFGVRTVGSVILPSGGRAFTVNGRIIRMTGGAWIPDYLMSWSAQRYRDEIRLMAEGNHTVVRVNGCGLVAPDVFYDACDRYGVLVWQDLSRTSSLPVVLSPKPCNDAALYLDNMRDCIYRLRGRTSLLVWCGSNEAVPQADIGRPLQDDILPALDGTRPWLPSSHVQPDWGKEKIAISSGGPYWPVRLPEYFRLYARDPLFVAKNEIGLGSMPPINTIVKAIPDHEQPETAWFPLNRTLGYHDACDCFRVLDKFIRQDMGEPCCLTEYLCEGDLYNSQIYRAIFEAANKARPRNAGTHLWKTNAAWTSMMWQVFDWYLRPNAGYYSMKSACRPLHVQTSADDWKVQVASTLAEDHPGMKLRIELVDASGKKDFNREYTVDVKADATTPAAALPDLIKDGRLRFLRLTLLDPAGRELDRTVTWVQKDCRWQELMALGPAQVKLSVLRRGQENGETHYDLCVENTSPLPAVNVWVQVLRGELGDEVLPSFWSDNALTLLPGESRYLHVQFRSGLLADAKPWLVAEGWNVQPSGIAAADGKPLDLALKIINVKVKPAGKTTLVECKLRQLSTPGPHWVTWPVALRVDGRLVRCLRVGLHEGAPTVVKVALPGLAAGSHRVVVGDREEIVTVEAPSSPR